jgi:hypothetical protein
MDVGHGSSLRACVVCNLNFSPSGRARLHFCGLLRVALRPENHDVFGAVIDSRRDFDHLRLNDHVMDEQCVTFLPAVGVARNIETKGRNPSLSIAPDDENASDINDVRPVKQRVTGRQAPRCKAQSHAAVKSDSQSRARLSGPQSRSSGVAEPLARDLVL